MAGVVMSPQTAVYHGIDNLQLGGAAPVDLLRQSVATPDGESSDLDLLLAVGGDDLAGVDGRFELRRVRGHAEEAECDRHDVVREDRQPLGVSELEEPISAKPRMELPPQQLRSLLEGDARPPVHTRVTKGRELRQQSFQQAVTVGIETGRTRLNEIVETALVFLFKNIPHFMENRQALVEHGDGDVAGEDLVQLAARHSSQVIPIQNGNPLVVGSLETGLHPQRVPVLGSLVLSLEDGVALEVGEREIDGRSEEDEVHGNRVVPLGSEGGSKIGPGQLLVGHPAGYLAHLLFVEAHVPGPGDHRLQTVQNRTAGEFILSCRSHRSVKRSCQGGNGQHAKKISSR